MSSAHVIEATRLAETLAVLRGRPAAGLGEVVEATRAVLCDGDEVRLALVNDRLVVGDRIGGVPADAPSVPLVRDVAAAQKRLRLPPEALARTIDLDLRKPVDLERSRLLRRLRLLGVEWGEPAEVAPARQGHVLGVVAAGLGAGVHRRPHRRGGVRHDGGGRGIREGDGGGERSAQPRLGHRTRGGVPARGRARRARRGARRAGREGRARRRRRAPDGQPARARAVAALRRRTRHRDGRPRRGRRRPRDPRLRRASCRARRPGRQGGRRDTGAHRRDARRDRHAGRGAGAARPVAGHRCRPSPTGPTCMVSWPDGCAGCCATRAGWTPSRWSCAWPGR